MTALKTNDILNFVSFVDKVDVCDVICVRLGDVLISNFAWCIAQLFSC